MIEDSSFAIAFDLVKVRHSQSYAIPKGMPKRPSLGEHTDTPLVMEPTLFPGFFSFGWEAI